MIIVDNQYVMFFNLKFSLKISKNREVLRLRGIFNHGVTLILVQKNEGKVRVTLVKMRVTTPKMRVTFVAEN